MVGTVTVVEVVAEVEEEADLAAVVEVVVVVEDLPPTPEEGVHHMSGEGEELEADLPETKRGLLLMKESAVVLPAMTEVVSPRERKAGTGRTAGPRTRGEPPGRGQGHKEYNRDRTQT